MVLPRIQKHEPIEEQEPITWTVYQVVEPKKGMTIRLSTEVALALETVAAQTRGLEFSGFGWAEVKDGALEVYDIVVLNVGTGSYTEIDGKTMYELSQREDAANMKVWFHRHPLGNGIPGLRNWSGMDEDTIETMPLGGIPRLVKWSASIVRTPHGWVGRIDNHIQMTTMHLPVVPQVSRELLNRVDELYNRRLGANHQRAIIVWEYDPIEWGDKDSDDWLEFQQDYFDLLDEEEYFD